MSSEVKLSDLIRRNSVAIEEFAGSSSQLMGLVLFLLELAERDTAEPSASPAKAPWVPAPGELLRRKYDGAIVTALKYEPSGYVRYEKSDGSLGSDHIRSVEAASPAKAGDGWIRCSERMPAEGQFVCIWVVDRGFYAHFYGGRFTRVGQVYPYDPSQILLWCPMPAPPSQETNGG